MRKMLLSVFLVIVCLFSANAKIVLSENFDLFTAGSDVAPDMSNPLMDVTGLTQTDGWAAMYVCQAGGSVYFPVGSALITPAVDVSANGGNYVVTFKAKSDSSPGMVLVTDAYMYSYGFSELTPEWQEYSITLTGGSQATQVAFQAMYSDFYIDDLVISDGGIEIPVAKASTNFTRESFTANWEAAQGATSYLLDVFTLVYNTETTVFEPVYLLKEKEVTGTSYVVTEGEYDVPYYYEVAGKAGNSVSKKSNRITVSPLPEEVAAPVANNASLVTSDSFLASWGASDIATKYYLHIVKEHKAVSNETYTFVNTDYSEFTEGTLDEPRKELEYLFDGDWSATVPVMANGCIGINNEDISFFGQGAIMSPLVQLGSVDKQIEVNFKAIARMGMTKGLVQLMCFNQTGYLSSTVKKEIELSEDTWGEYSVVFENIAGVAVAVVITSEEAGRMFIDDLNATVSLNAGDVLELPVRTYDVADLSCTATNFGICDNDRICYYVNASWAVRQQEGVVRQIPEVVSEPSNIVWVDELLSGIDFVEECIKSRVVVNGNTINVTNPAMANIAILSVDGKLVHMKKNASLQNAIVVNALGVYVVAVGNELHKVIVK